MLSFNVEALQDAWSHEDVLASQEELAAMLIFLLLGLGERSCSCCTKVAELKSGLIDDFERSGRASKCSCRHCAFVCMHAVEYGGFPQPHSGGRVVQWRQTFM